MKKFHPTVCIVRCKDIWMKNAINFTKKTSMQKEQNALKQKGKQVWRMVPYKEDDTYLAKVLQGVSCSGESSATALQDILSSKAPILVSLSTRDMEVVRALGENFCFE